jgi:spermidine/putrescine transport system permease protein
MAEPATDDTGEPNRGTLTATQRRTLAAVGLIGPAYLWLLLTVFLPLAALFYFSFLTLGPLIPRPAEWTLEHYNTYFAKDFYRVLMTRSLWMGFHVTALCLLIGFPAAWVLARVITGRWREALFLLVILPFWTNALVRTFSWTVVLRGNGLIDQVVHAVLPFAPSLGILYSYPAIVLGLVHAYVPYMILTCYLSLQAIDQSLIEAARSLGGSWPRIFRKVIFPLSLPGVAAGAILIFVPVVGSFMEPRILGGRQAIGIGTVIEDQFVSSPNWPLGSALSFILLALVLLILVVIYPLVRGRLGEA